jgi:hypothetical protein
MNKDSKSLVKEFFDLLSCNPPDIAGAVQLLDGDVQDVQLKQKFATDFQKGLPHFTGTDIKDVAGVAGRVDAAGKVKTATGPIEDIVIYFTIDKGMIKEVDSNKIVQVDDPVDWPAKYPRR